MVTVANTLLLIYMILVGYLLVLADDEYGWTRRGPAWHGHGKLSHRHTGNDSHAPASPKPTTNPASHSKPREGMGRHRRDLNAPNATPASIRNTSPNVIDSSKWSLTVKPDSLDLQAGTIKFELTRT